MNWDNKISNFLSFSLSTEQRFFVEATRRLWISTKDRCVLVLNGYAGTGKTSIIGGLVKFFRREKLKFVLLTPTGKSAKVLQNYAQYPAFTIHKHIYQSVQKQGKQHFNLRENKSKNTLFIVDEASMISGERQYFASGRSESLLDDLIEFVFSGHQCKLILLGDQAQLPPVHSVLSPALDLEVLKNEFDLNAAKCHFTQVHRQAQESGILLNATLLRLKITGKLESCEWDWNFEDFQAIRSQELLELYEEKVDEYGSQNVLIITRSNKQALRYNQAIRHRVLYLEDTINGGDRLMVVKNNYQYTLPDAGIHFIANGESMLVNRIKGFEEKYGLQFADVDLHLEDYQCDFSAKILLSVLNSESASLPEAEMTKLYEQIDAELLEEFPRKQERRQELRKNPYLNALQVKYAYAITGHKSQGGQWDVVFTDPGFAFDVSELESCRWLYTAITRAKKAFFWLNFSPGQPPS